MARNEEIAAHVVPDLPSDDDDEEEEETSCQLLEKLKSDVLYCLRMAGAEGKYNYKLERISGTEQEDSDDNGRLLHDFMNRPIPIHVLAKNSHLLHQKNLRTSTTGHNVIAIDDPEDNDPLFEWRNQRNQREEEVDLIDAKEAAKQASRTICVLEHASEEECFRRRRQLETIVNRKRRSLIIAAYS